MGDHDGSRTQCIVEAADQVAHHAERDRIQPGERFIVHNEHRIQRHRACQRHAPRHAAGQLGRHQVLRAIQPHCMQLHHHQVADDLLRQVGMFAHLECHIVEHRHVGEQRAELEQHAHLAPHLVQTVAVQLVDDLAIHLHLTPGGLQHPADMAQYGGLATTGKPHDGDQLALGEGHVDAFQYGATVIGKIDIADFDQCWGCHGAEPGCDLERAF